MPWRIQSDSDRSQAAAALADFRSKVLVPGGLSDSAAELLKRGVIRRISTETDPARDIWIMAGRIEHPRSMFSLLHARVDDANYATVDLLIALTDPGFIAGYPYRGYGEFALLSLLLESMCVSRLRVPIPLDTENAGLVAAGWLPSASTGDVYVRGETPG